MTKLNMVLEYLREHPEASDKEISENLGIIKKTVNTYVYRLALKGFIKVIGTPSDRVVEIIKEPDVSKSDYKKEIFKQMIDTYLDDFENASSIQERNSIGLMITRLIDRL